MVTGFKKEITIIPFRKHFNFDLLLDLLHPKYSILSCFSSIYNYKLNLF